MNDQVEAAKAGADLLSFGIAVGTLAKLLPAIAALFTIIWTAIRIYETKTVQKMLGKGEFK